MLGSSLAEVLGHYIHRAHSSVNRLAKLSGVPKQTIANWLEGRIRKPRRWQDVARVAAALHLSEAEAEALLRAAGQGALADLRSSASAPDCALLAPFQSSNSPISPSPFQAIAALPTFVGREAELNLLKRAVLEGGHASVCGLRGMGGVGKTMLAARLAYDVREQFPDGVLWARLDTSDTLTILGQFADAYGKDVRALGDVDSRAAVVRDLLNAKRALLVLDNAETSAQVRPLLPPNTSACAVLVTTRNDLTVTDGWARLSLEPFTNEADSLKLFERFLGQATTSARRPALLELAALLGHLPLALSIVAGLISNSLISLDAILSSIRSAARLDVLNRDDHNVRLSFDASYAALPPALQNFFAALGVFGGEDFSAEAVTAVTETAVAEAEAHLRGLVRRSLAQESRVGRWRLHPLLRDYAREKLNLLPLYPTARLRMVDYFIRVAQDREERGYSSLIPDLSNILYILELATDLDQPALVVRIFATFQTVLDRMGYHRALNVERLKTQVSVAAEKLADKSELPQTFFAMAAIEAESGYDYARAEEYARHALKWARELAQWEMVARCLNLLGSLCWYQGERARADEFGAEAEAVARQHGLHRTLASLTNGRGIRAVELGQFAEAKAAFKTFEAYCRKEQHAHWLVACLGNLGEVFYRQRQYEQADAHFAETLAVAEQAHGARPAGIVAMRGLIAAASGNPAQAEAYANEAAQLARASGHPRGLSAVLGSVGEIAQSIGQSEQARQYWQEGLDIARRLNLKNHMSDLAGRLGRWHLEHGHPEAADELLEEAYRYASDLKSESLLANALFGRAQLAAARNRLPEARRLAEKSLAQFNGVHDWHAEEVCAWLEKLEGR